MSARCVGSHCMRSIVNMKNKVMMSHWGWAVCVMIFMSFTFCNQAQADYKKSNKPPFEVRFEVRTKKVDTGDSVTNHPSLQRMKPRQLQADTKTTLSRKIKSKEKSSLKQKLYFSNLYSENFKLFQSRSELDQYLAGFKIKKADYKPNIDSSKTKLSLPPKPESPLNAPVVRRFSVE